MFDLLKTDLRRAFKDKLFIVLCIIAGAFAIITPLLYKGIFALLKFNPDLPSEMEAFGLIFNAKSMFFGSFSLGNNFGLMLPIFVAIILCKDFSNGTIRNKVICGKSRASIYFSMLITCTILICFFILAHALLTLLISLLMFDYQPTPFTINDFGYLMASIGLEMIIYIFICALLTFFIVTMKNAGLAIVMYFVVSFVLMLVGSITQTTIILADPAETTYKVLEFFNTANAFVTTIIGNGTGYKLKDVLYVILPNLVTAIGLIIWGLLAFKKKDLK